MMKKIAIVFCILFLFSGVAVAEEFNATKEIVRIIVTSPKTLDYVLEGLPARGLRLEKEGSVVAAMVIVDKNKMLSGLLIQCKVNGTDFKAMDYQVDFIWDVAELNSKGCKCWRSHDHDKIIGFIRTMALPLLIELESDGEAF